MHSRTVKIPNYSTISSDDNEYIIPERINASASDVLNYLLRYGTDQQVNFVLYLDGKVNEKLMKKAIRLALDAEPILGSRLIKNVRKPYWKRREDLDNEDYFKVIKEKNNELLSKQFILRQIDPSEEPLIQVRIYRDKTDSIAIKSDHSVMDGGGFYDFLTLLASIYNELLKDPIYLVKPNLTGDRSVNQVLKHYNFRSKLKSFLKETTSSPTWSFPAIGSGKIRKNFILKRFSKERFQIIKEYGKNHNATINDMFLTAFFRGLFQIQKPKPGSTMIVSVPTDLRSLLPERKAETIANLVSSTFAAAKYNPDESFADTLAQISQQMKKKKEIHLGLGYMYIIKNIFRIRFSFLERIVKMVYNRLTKKGKMHPILTNVGMIDSQKRHFGDVNVIDGYLVTPVNWSPSFSMGISSFDKKLTLSVGFCEDSYSKESVERFLEFIDQQLPK